MLELAANHLVAVLVFVGALVVIVHRQIAARKESSLLPPGPPVHWLFGSPLPGPYAHIKFAEWTEQYGPVFSLRKGREITIIIGRVQEANEIMEKEGSSLADRPRNIAAGETLSGGMRTLLVPTGNQFRKLRRALHARLSQKESQNYEPIQMEHARNMVLDVLENPTAHQMHAKRYAAALVLTLTYGKRTPTYPTDPIVTQINLCLTRLGQTLLPGAWLVDAYPALRFVPGYLRVLKGWHAEELALFRGMVRGVRADVAGGRAPESFARFLLEHQAEFELADDELAYVAGSMFGAGADTTAAAISIAIMAAAAFPETQAKVQEELDLVLAGRAPTFADEDSLPQLRAFILETYRWKPVSIGGVAHRATKDIIWRGYTIPKGASVVANHWAICRDPVVFPDPERFDPQRWLTADGSLRQDVKSYPFGFGRRICPGQHLADGSIFITTALNLWAFRIAAIPSKPLDTMAFTDTMNTHPLPFQVSFVPRHDRGGDGLRAELKGYAIEGGVL